MPLEHHPLSREFPQDLEKMRDLHSRDPQFAGLALHYETLDKRIYAVENGREALDDLALQALKSERVQLKDQIAERLRQADSDD